LVLVSSFRSPTGKADAIRLLVDFPTWSPLPNTGTLSSQLANLLSENNRDTHQALALLHAPGKVLVLPAVSKYVLLVFDSMRFHYCLGVDPGLWQIQSLFDHGSRFITIVREDDS
jgi:hypothetical protein